MTLKTTFFYFFLTASLSLLVSCGGQPTRPIVNEPPITSSAESIQQLLEDAQSSSSPVREEKQLKAAGLLLDAGQRDLVDQLLANISPQTLSLNLFARYAAVLSRLHIDRGQYENALLILETPRLQENQFELSQSEQLQLSLLRAEVYALQGSHIASAQQRIFIAPLLTAEDQPANQQALWRSLMYVPMDDIKHYLSSSYSGEYQGWLQLALIAKENQEDLDEQVRQLDQWQRLWPTHPANGNLPGGLELIKELAANRPEQIALLLPLSGKLATYGKAVRDGFIAAMYQTRQQGARVPSIRIYNTDDQPDFIALYHRAVAEGAEMIVGPLEKHRLSLLFDQLVLPVPTLALNRVDDYGTPPNQLFQFGLAPQDEAKQIAEIAFLEHKRRALVISPKGTWGDKVSNTFIQRWQELGGEVAAVSRYSGQQDYSSSLKNALALQISEQRAKRIEKLARQPIEFTPRRRADIDMAFLLARPQQARSIKPLLAYHYAGDLPVYGTSRLYSGYDNPVKDRDINGIRFTDMPWVLNKASILKQQIHQEISNSQQYQRMYALGIDSFQLHPRLRQLNEVPNSRVYGQTGTLKLNARREIERQMLLANIINNQAQLVPIVDQSLHQLSTKDGLDNDQKQADN